MGIAFHLAGLALQFRLHCRDIGMTLYEFLRGPDNSCTCLDGMLSQFSEAFFCFGCQPKSPSIVCLQLWCQLQAGWQSLPRVYCMPSLLQWTLTSCLLASWWRPCRPRQGMPSRNHWRQCKGSATCLTCCAPSSTARMALIMHQVGQEWLFSTLTVAHCQSLHMGVSSAHSSFVLFRPLKVFVLAALCIRLAKYRTFL